MIATDSNRELDLDMDILSILISEEQELVRPVLCLMREVAELTNVDRAALWHQLCVSEDKIIRIREERKLESSNMAKEKAAISQRLTESENVNKRLKLEMKAETDRITRERKENAEQLQEAESQLEWLRSERDEEIAKVTDDKRALHDRLHEAETQLSQLKSRNRDELKIKSLAAELCLDRAVVLEYLPDRLPDPLFVPMFLVQCLYNSCFADQKPCC